MRLPGVGISVTALRIGIVRLSLVPVTALAVGTALIRLRLTAVQQDRGVIRSQICSAIGAENGIIRDLASAVRTIHESSSFMERDRLFEGQYSTFSDFVLR